MNPERQCDITISWKNRTRLVVEADIYDPEDKENGLHVQPKYDFKAEASDPKDYHEQMAAIVKHAAKVFYKLTGNYPTRYRVCADYNVAIWWQGYMKFLKELTDWTENWIKTNAKELGEEE